MDEEVPTKGGKEKYSEYFPKGKERRMNDFRCPSLKEGTPPLNVWDVSTEV